MLKIHRNVIAANIGRHGDYRSIVELSDQVGSRYSVEVRHNDVHQDQIVLGAGVHLVDSLESIQLLQVRKAIPRILCSLLTALSTEQ